MGKLIGIQPHMPSLNRNSELVSEESTARRQTWRRALEKAYHAQADRRNAIEAKATSEVRAAGSGDASGVKERSPQVPVHTESTRQKIGQGAERARSPAGAGANTSAQPDGTRAYSMLNPGSPSVAQNSQKGGRGGGESIGSKGWETELRRHAYSKNFSFLPLADGVHIVVRARPDEMSQVERLLPLIRSILAKYSVKVYKITVNGESAWVSDFLSINGDSTENSRDPEIRLSELSKARY